MRRNKYIDIVIVGFIFIVLFTMPVLFIRVGDNISWKHVLKIWQDNSLLVPVFAINHLILLPVLMRKKRYLAYSISILLIIVSSALVCHHIDPALPASYQDMPRPTPIPPYANMLMYAILIVGVDVGLFYSKMWQINEQRGIELEQKNTAMELELLRNQVSPHFFMNTLNNIYALVDCDAYRAKVSVMKLSKLMRYLLYENNAARVKLSREFEFVESYIDLARIRYTNDVVFEVEIPENYDDIMIPPMLFISYIENAVKYGVSYQEKCVINIKFRIQDHQLLFNCSNPVHGNYSGRHKGGIGLENSNNRLNLIYGDNFDLTITQNQSQYCVSLTIPV